MTTISPAYNYDELNKVFRHNQTLRVIFRKKDGTKRTMICTRQLGMIPTEFHPKSDTPKKDMPWFPVFDLEAGGWRSFRYDSIISIQI